MALALVLVFLPGLEAPKNVAIALFLGLWSINRWRSGDWGGPWGIWDGLIVFMVTSAYLSAAAGAFPPQKGLAAANRTFVFGSVFFAVRRSGFSSSFLRLLIALAIVSTLATLAVGFWDLWVTHGRAALELKSVGHVNHSAIYIALVFCFTYSWLLAEDNRRGERLLLGCAAGLLLVSLFLTAARGAIIPVVIFVLVSALLRSKSLKRSLAGALGILTIVALALIAVPGVVEKTKSGAESGQLTSYRPALARTALLAAREYPFFGVGITNFGKITPKLAGEWQERSGHLFKQESLFFTSHAHNVFFNALAEQGAIGFVALLAFLSIWALTLWRRRPDRANVHARMLWTGALGAWVVITFGGIFNTTLHHENAILSLMMLGFWLGSGKSQE